MTLILAKILGFNIRALNPNLRSQVSANNVEIFYHSIIYKLIDDVIARLESMLAPRIETSVTGEAQVSEIFDVTIKGKKKPVAGSKVFNGTISIKEKCRITRGGKIVYTGRPPSDLTDLKANWTLYDTSRTMSKKYERVLNVVSLSKIIMI
jgi:translation initiation factor IF-2